MKTIRSGFTPMDRPSHPSGFTLLELMIGLVISIILASIAIPSFSRAIEKTKVKDAQSTLAALFSSEKIYRLDQGSYGTLANLVDNNYITNPNAGNTTWFFSSDIPAPPPPPATTFAATATRTPPGGTYGGKTIKITQDFDGTNYDCDGYEPALCP